MSSQDAYSGIVRLIIDTATPNLRGRRLEIYLLLRRQAHHHEGSADLTRLNTHLRKHHNTFKGGVQPHEEYQNAISHLITEGYISRDGLD